MLARRLEFTCADRTLESPLLVPSFSSKGSVELSTAFITLGEYLNEAYLLSAYDLQYGYIAPPDQEYSEIVFIDSGGYEANKSVEMEDLGYIPSTPKSWEPNLHMAALNKWPKEVAAILVSYDHPEHRVPLTEQISAAKTLFAQFPGFGHEFLIKPETSNQKLVQLKNIAAHAGKLADFDVVGVTEQELGRSLFERMKSIATLRETLKGAGLEHLPVHVFGSLDPISTPLYFVAGADIFDGLTWLRYAYHEGRSLNHDDGIILKRNFKEPYTRGTVSNLADNLVYLMSLALQMRRYVDTGCFSVFDFHKSIIERASVELQTALARRRGL